jgi:hypothetical protein
MFLQDADMTCLRQGDILRDVPIPLLASPEIAVLGRIDATASGSAPALSPLTKAHRKDPNWLTAQLPVRRCYCVVMSQCCDLAPRNERILMPAFAVGRLIPIPNGISEDPKSLESLRANKDPRNPGDPGFINLFYFPRHERLDNAEWMVDFNQCASIPSTEFPAILDRKILQMEDPWRVKSKIKLAASYARLTDEERDSGLENPWATA